MDYLTYCGISIKIEQDEDPRNPREDSDPLGKMICFHGRYDLGDKHEYRHEDYNGWDAMKAAIQKQEDAAIILPLYLYDHSGITMRTTPFTCPWDSGQVGFIFVSKEKAREEYGRLTKKTIEKITKYLIDEVAEYDTYLTGDVWGYIVDKGSENEQSCWGHFGYDYCVEEAKREAYFIAKKLCSPSIYG